VKQARQDGKHTFGIRARLGCALASALLLALLAAAPASAAFEQVGHFAEGGIEGDGLSNAAGIAVNASGAGGVAPGTVYGEPSNKPGVYRYSATGEFLDHFAGGGKGIAIDQSTGYVYVLAGVLFGGVTREHENIHVYSADGSELIAAFGDGGTSSETFEQSPEKIHAIYYEGGLAVDEEGTVYVTDNAAGPDGSRVMTFKPQSPGDYEHYVYTGRANDVDTTGVLGTDEAGDLYSTGYNAGKTSNPDARAGIFEFAPGETTTPSCEFTPPSAVVFSLAVNAKSGAVFYYDEKTPKVVHQLGPCEEGEFEDQGSFEVTPKTQIRALGLNPSLAWEPSRPKGVLYGAQFTNLGLGYIFAPPKVFPPSVESQWASAVTATTATLNAAINPKGNVTHYAFQYETEAEYEANEPTERFAGAGEAPLGGATLPAGQKAQSAVASLVGLSPDTDYRYRVIAASHCNPEDEEEACEDIGEARSFRTYPVEAPGLPDHRAWELVSPAQKSGGEAFVLEPDGGSALVCATSARCKPGSYAPLYPTQSSPDGEAVVYEGFPFSSEEGASIFNSYIARRNEKTGWQTTILAPALLGGSPSAYTAFDTNLTKGILYQDAPSLTPSAPSEVANLYTQPTATPSSLTALLSEEPPNRQPGPDRLQLRYAGASDDLSRIFFAANDALTGETPFAPEAVDGGQGKYNLYEWAGGQLRLVNVLPGNAETIPGAGFGSRVETDLPHAISADGSRVFWSDEAGQVYVRIDGESTVAIPDPGKYLTASEDGSEVLLEDGHLYDLQTEAIADLTEGQGGFQGIAGASDDLSQIYFVDTAALTGEEENEYGAKAQAGEDNLYAWADGGIAFVATLSHFGKETDALDWSTSPPRRTAETSPDGRWLAFQSTRPLTGYDNFGPTCRADASELEYVAENCVEAFLYDSESGELRCASCSPSGSRPLGPSRLPTRSGAQYLPQPRYLLDSGRLYFDSQDALSPADTNRAFDTVTAEGERLEANGAGAEDVYEYEPEGVGTCEREGGCIHLLSGGHESGDSNFLAIDETGANVFFTTRDQLVLKDRDDLMDVYDAREFGGIPSETETARGECQGEACQPQVSPPNDPTPGSSAFEGAGNVVEEPAAKKHRKHHKHRHKAKRHRHKRAKHNRGGAR